MFVLRGDLFDRKVMYLKYLVFVLTNRCQGAESHILMMGHLGIVAYVG